MAVMIWSEAAGAFIEPEDILACGADGVYYSVPQINAPAADGVWGQVWPERLYLYKTGDECIGVTGGWAPYASAGATATKDTDSLTITMNGDSYYQTGQFCPKKAIDFTGYSKLCFLVFANVGAFQYINDGSECLCLIEQYKHYQTGWMDSDLWPTNPYSGGKVFKEATIGEYIYIKTTLPPEPAYPAIRCANGTAKAVLTFKFKEIWLEK